MESQALNVRDITDYLYCKRKSYLKKTRGSKERINARMVRGKMRHEIFDDFNNIEKELILSLSQNFSISDLEEIYKKVFFEITKKVVSHGDMALRFMITLQNFWEESLSSFNREIQPRVMAVHALIQKGIFKEDLWEKLQPKYITEMRVKSAKLNLAGRIDRVSIIKQEKGEIYVPFEIKTGNASQPYESDIIQLASYALLIEETFNVSVEYGYVEYSDNQLKIDITKSLKDAVVEIVENIRKINESKIPPINENPHKCRSCSLKEECFSIKGGV
ncbi:MAG: CRISPR-associated protein Cas4 [archaeon]